MAGNKRQHYVPRFLLRRFAIASGRWQGHIFRLPVTGGPARPARPKTEAAKSRYYDLPEELVGEFQPEKALAKIESVAASAICCLEQRREISEEQFVLLGYFVALQTSRTPQDRAEARFADEFMASQFKELQLSARDRAIEFIRKLQPELTEEEADAERLRMLEELNAGEIKFESTADREVAHMFLGLNEAVEQILHGCDFNLVEISGGPELVLPDSGYTRYDPRPRIPGTGSGFFGTPTVETAIPLSPASVLVITRGSGGVSVRKSSATYAEDLNLRAFAQSAVCVYGRGQKSVVDARKLARRRRSDLVERRRRPRTTWILEHAEGAPDDAPMLGRGYSVEGTRTAWFDVDPRAREGQPVVSAEDLWSGRG